MKIGKITVELRVSGNGQIGIFPEQLTNWQWLIKKLEKIDRPVKILNTFAYTGVATLLMSAANEKVEVWHVDGAKSAVSWAKQNAKLSGLKERPIHWIVEDVMKFLEREVKRGHKYDGLVLDPPAFGRGEGSVWKLERDLPKLMDLAEKILSDSPCFVILSCHAQNINSKDLLFLLQDLKQFGGQKGEVLDLVILSEKGHDLPAGSCARI
jgi:23S rRNA (cytosine1962-C5)-methyltransferase